MFQHSLLCAFSVVENSVSCLPFKSHSFQIKCGVQKVPKSRRNGSDSRMKSSSTEIPRHIKRIIQRGRKCGTFSSENIKNISFQIIRRLAFTSFLEILY